VLLHFIFIKNASIIFLAKYKNTNIPHLKGLRFAQTLGTVDSVPSEKLVWFYIKDQRSETIAVPESKVDALKNFIPNWEKNVNRYFGNLERTLKNLTPKVTLDKFVNGRINV